MTTYASLPGIPTRILLFAAPFALAALLGCPAAATQFQAVMADSSIVETDPTPSPDGKWLAFTKETGPARQIWIRPIGGGDARQLTNEPDTSRAMTPTWAPDSKSLLFISNRTKEYNVYSIPLEGGEPRAMSHVAASNRFATYAPDGKEIVFPSNRMKPCEIFGFDLYAMDAGGERADRPARRLTNNQGSPGHPTWSPDGAWIAYVAKPIDTTRMIQVAPGMTMPQSAMFTAYHLWRIPRAGGTEVQLTGHALASETAETSSEEVWPTWSPDGKWIAVQRRVGAADDVWLYEISSGKFFRLTTFGNAGKPTWSADGKSIWFVRSTATDQDIWVASKLTAEEPAATPGRPGTKKRIP